MSDKPPQIHVLLVDDSAVIRTAMKSLIEEDPAITVIATAKNGEEAIKEAQTHKPHIIMLDVEMPVMDGITALPKVLEASPKSKVLMFSALTEKGASVTMNALSLGAIECVVKPAAGEARSGTSFHKALLIKIKAIVPARHRIGAKPVSTPAPSIKAATPIHSPTGNFTLRNEPSDFKGKPDIILIGSSTGGPQALFNVTSHLTGLNIPIVITQHMPATFTKILAEHIQENSKIECHEAQDGMQLEAGKAYVAPGGKHMVFEKTPIGPNIIRLNDGPAENFCKPAVDPMFSSALEVFDNRMIAVILTGMGQDGLASARLITEKGVRLVAQDEATSVVWGMPGNVAKEGLCSAVLPLDDIGPWIRNVAV